MRDRLIEEPNYCDYCCNFDKEHIGMDGMAVCKLTNKIVYSEDGGDCPFFNVPKEGIIVPPCKEHDLVYDLVLCDDNKYRIFDMRVGKVVPYGSVYNDEVWNVYLIGTYTYAYRSFYDFGKTVFLTREEAERTLEGRKEE